MNALDLYQSRISEALTSVNKIFKFSYQISDFRHIWKHVDQKINQTPERSSDGVKWNSSFRYGFGFENEKQ